MSGLSLIPLLVATALLAFAPQANAAGPTFRIEVHPVSTLTLTPKQLLAGSKDDAAPATIAGELRLPFGAAARMPAASPVASTPLRSMPPI